MKAHQEEEKDVGEEEVERQEHDRGEDDKDDSHLRGNNGDLWPLRGLLAA